MKLNTKDTMNEPIIIGRNKKFLEQVERARKARSTNAPVLICGETGTGKELFARLIHGELSDEHPFVAQNCSAIPSSLFEGIFFGTEKGAFTESIKRKGLFEQAKNGTLLLDELNSLPIYLQSKLLRVLQENTMRRIGGTEEIPLNCRVISTLNEEPEKLIEEGKLRTDLFYRINVIRINIPSLYERPDDIPLLVEYFVCKYAKKYNCRLDSIPSSFYSDIKARKFPGNVRELENHIESYIAMEEYNY